MRILVAMVFALVLCGCGAFQASRARTGAGPQVETETGSIRGVAADGIASFKGIPFAQPPVGPLRWRAPQPASPWRGVRDAGQYGPDCMQTPFAEDAAPLRTAPSEDCLYLNVWTPASAPARQSLPVIVWIYGGGFVSGGASPAVYEGAELARQGVVLVSFNYRLGRFGFFAHPALSRAREDGGLTGNYGYMDQIAALKWVRANIAAFGGDPLNVTIMGESAGGVSVHALMTSPLARGLFAKAVVMSGGGRANLLGGESIADAERAGTEFARWAGAEGDGDEALARLRALPAAKLAEGVGLEALFAALNGAPPAAPPPSGPIIDGHILVDSPEAVYRRGEAARAPLLAGATSADLGFADGDDPFARFQQDEARAREVYQASVDGDELRAAHAVAMDATMIEPARYVVSAVRREGQPGYYYRAGYVPTAMRSAWAGGLPHASDIPLFFRTLDRAHYLSSVSESDQAMSALMSAYIVNFASSGDPNGPNLPLWPIYDPQARPVMRFTNEGAIGGGDPWRARLDLAESVAERAEGR